MYIYYLIIVLNGNVDGRLVLDMPSMTACEAQKNIYEQVVTTNMACKKVLQAKVKI